MARANPENNPGLLNLQRIAEAALVVALFTALAWQFLRTEVFETEKNAILIILALVIVAANAVEYIQLRRLPKFGNPLTLAVFAFVGVAAISTVFSISFSYSFWGSPTRGHGLVMVMIYAVLFWQALRSGQRLQGLLFPVLTMIAVAMMVYAIQDYVRVVSEGTIRYRPSSTAGNPNFLAGWLTMFILIFGLTAFQRFTQWERPLKRYRQGQLAMYIGILITALVTFVILSSRGALAGMGVGVVVAAIILLTLYRRRRVLAGVITIALVLGGVYLAISAELQSQGRFANFSGVERLFILNDESRFLLWLSATEIITQQAVPFEDAEGERDDWAFLRPAIGYGLETLEQVQDRFPEEFQQSEWGNRFVERFHNLFWDWAAEVGSLGALTIIIIYQTAFYLALRRLGFVNAQSAWYWLGLQLLFIPVGVVITALVMYEAEWTALIPLGGALGSLIGTVLWIIRWAFLPVPTEEDIKNETNTIPPPRVMNPGTITVIALLCVLCSQWIDNQFGFMQIHSQTLMFILLGLLAYLTSAPEEIDAITVEEADTVRESTYWHVSTLIAGLFFIYAFGIAIESEFTQAQIGSVELPFFLVIIFAIGSLMGYFSRQEEGERLQDALSTKAKSNKKRRAIKARAERTPLVYILGGTLGLWVLFFGYKYILVQTGSDNFDAALESQPNQVATNVRNAYMFLALNGVGVIAVALAVMYWNIRGTLRFALPIVGTTVVLLSFAGGSLLYAQNYALSTMRASAIGFTGLDGEAPIVTADRIFDGAVDLRPGDVKLRLNWVDSLIAQISYTNDPNRQLELYNRIVEEHEKAFNASPFFHHSRTYQAFEPRYTGFIRAIQRANGAANTPLTSNPPANTQQNSGPPDGGPPPNTQPQAPIGEPIEPPPPNAELPFVAPTNNFTPQPGG